MSGLFFVLFLLFEVHLAVVNDRGLSAIAVRMMSATVPTSSVNQAPVAFFEAECVDLHCTYREAGAYQIDLTVSDADGERSVAAQTVMVSEPPPPPIASGGIWVGKEEISALPTHGPAWEQLQRDAARDPGVADVSDQDSHHDVYTLAQALVCVRTGEFCAKARTGVLAAIDTEEGGRWLAVGRNLTAYVIAADLLELRRGTSTDGDRVHAWIERFLTRTLAHNNDSSLQIRLEPFSSGSNASAQEGAAYIAVAAYLNDAAALKHAWAAYRRFVCDPSAPDPDVIELNKGIEYGWAHNDEHACAINPKGSTKVVPEGRPGAGTTRRLDGAIINDMRRGGEFQWAPGYTQYPWVGLEGLVPAALILDRAGYPTFEIVDQAVLRTLEYLWFLRTETGVTEWFDGVRADEIVHLVNYVYGTAWPVQSAVGRGRTVGYTDWSHPLRKVCGHIKLREGATKIGIGRSLTTPPPTPPGIGIPTMAVRCG